MDVRSSAHIGPDKHSCPGQDDQFDQSTKCAFSEPEEGLAAFFSHKSRAENVVLRATTRSLLLFLSFVLSLHFFIDL